MRSIIYVHRYRAQCPRVSSFLSWRLTGMSAPVRPNRLRWPRPSARHTSTRIDQRHTRPTQEEKVSRRETIAATPIDRRRIRPSADSQWSTDHPDQQEAARDEAGCGYQSPGGCRQDIVGSSHASDCDLVGSWLPLGSFATHPFLPFHSLRLSISLGHVPL